MMTIRPFIFAGAGFVAIVTSSFVALEAAHSEPRVAVHYADLNLASANGQAVLDRRIQAAADTLCGTVPLRNLDYASAVRSCRDVAIRSAQPQRSSVVARRTVGAGAVLAAR